MKIAVNVKAENLGPEFTHQGARFLLAKVREQKPNVVAQYREDRLFSSRHAYLYANGDLVLDHADIVNPDRGKAASLIHFVADHPMGRAVGTIGGIILFRRFR